jgi:hypothetical protein
MLRSKIIWLLIASASLGAGEMGDWERQVNTPFEL